LWPREATPTLMACSPRQPVQRSGPPFAGRRPGPRA
jgi:hypothetical protein